MCSKSVSRVITVQGFILQAITAAETFTSISRLDVNFDSQWSVKYRSRAPRHGVCLKK